MKSGSAPVIALLPLLAKIIGAKSPLKTPTERLPLLAYLAGTRLAIVSSFVAVVELDVELLELDDESLLPPQAAMAVAAKATATRVSGALREVIVADHNAHRYGW
jgi:hypothetical protein